jgi:hypothetical protein
MTTTNYQPPAWMGPDLIPSPELCEQVKAAAAAFRPLRDSVLAYIAEHRPAFQAYHAWMDGIANTPDEVFDVCDEMMGYGILHRETISIGYLLEQLAENKLRDDQLEGWED